MSSLPTPANDGQDIEPEDRWTNCDCGSRTFNLMWRGGFHYILCAKCEHDHTNDTIWGKT